MLNKTNEKNWNALKPEEVFEILKNFKNPWWIAGGIALDLFLGKKTRKHLDIDVLILRKHQLTLQAYLKDWFLYKTNQPGLKPWEKNEYLKIHVNSIWCKKERDGPWKMEILFMDSEDEKWIYRREPKIRGMIEHMGKVTENGLPYLSPEIQLLFKSVKNRRSTDNDDFFKVFPKLNCKARKWLVNALVITYPNGHDWIKILEEF